MYVFKLAGIYISLFSEESGPDKGEKGVEGFEEAFKDLGK
jgi:hypothetical protein